MPRRGRKWHGVAERGQEVHRPVRAEARRQASRCGAEGTARGHWRRRTARRPLPHARPRPVPLSLPRQQVGRRGRGDRRGRPAGLQRPNGAAAVLRRRRAGGPRQARPRAPARAAAPARGHRGPGAVPRGVEPHRVVEPAALGRPEECARGAVRGAGRVAVPVAYRPRPQAENHGEAASFFGRGNRQRGESRVPGETGNRGPAFQHPTAAGHSRAGNPGRWRGFPSASSLLLVDPAVKGCVVAPHAGPLPARGNHRPERHSRQNEPASSLFS